VIKFLQSSVVTQTVG